MVDLIVTASQVLPDAAGTIVYGISGATLTAGACVYRDTATNTWKLYDCDAALTSVGEIGISLTGSSSGQPVAVQRTGSPTIGAGAAPAVGTVYLTSDTAGGIRPVADVDVGDLLDIVGVGATGNKIKLPEGGIFKSGQTTV